MKRLHIGEEESIIREEKSVRQSKNCRPNWGRVATKENATEGEKISAEKALLTNGLVDSLHTKIFVILLTADSNNGL